MNVQMEPTWKKALETEFSQQYFRELTETIRSAYLGVTPVYPPPKEVFNAFALCSFDSVRVVILGQDPYHGKDQAHGLCFSVRDGIRVPPSLQNIYRELHEDLGSPMPTSGDLTGWAQEGVLLPNATLTVLAGQAGSHQGIGWERFTDAVIEKLSNEKEHLVFLLWGRHAQEKGKIIDESRHLVLRAPHPSPLSAYTGFFGCKHFSKANAYLKAHGKEPIAW